MPFLAPTSRSSGLHLTCIHCDWGYWLEGLMRGLAACPGVPQGAFYDHPKDLVLHQFSIYGFGVLLGDLIFVSGQ